MGSEVNGAYRLNSATLSAPKVLGKIDLSSINSSTRPRKKSREEKRRERDERNHTGGTHRTLQEAAIARSVCVLARSVWM